MLHINGTTEGGLPDDADRRAGREGLRVFYCRDIGGGVAQLIGPRKIRHIINFGAIRKGDYKFRGPGIPLQLAMERNIQRAHIRKR